MKIPPILAGLLVTTLAHGAGTIRQEHDIPAIDRVVLETPGDLEIRPGAQARLSIEAEQKVLDALDFSTSGGTLTLRSKGGGFSTQYGINYVVVVPHLHLLSNRGSGGATVGAFHGDTLDVELAGSGNIALDGVEAKRLSLHVSGSGSIAATGNGDALKAEISGSGSIDAEHYAAARAEAKIGGSGEIRVHARERLDADISGAGNIRYLGKPSITHAITGAGSVDPL
ncbi:MAG: DUF2807 domain-containing protein [Azoarcus sp.]|jgi:hypothetical protein|nr:DUF2807 domain-containing protein [Azoarcus sp.]